MVHSAYTEASSTRNNSTHENMLLPYRSSGYTMGFDSPISPSSIYRDDVPRQEKRRSISYTDEDIQEDYKPFRQHAGIHRFNSFHQHEVQTLSQPPIHLELPDLAIIPDAPEHQEEGSPDQTWVIRRSMAFGEDVMDEDHPLPIKEYSVKRYQSILDEDDDSIFETSCGGAPTPFCITRNRVLKHSNNNNGK